MKPSLRHALFIACFCVAGPSGATLGCIPLPNAPCPPPPPPPANPKYAGDFVGRSLASPGLGTFGHVGLWIAPDSWYGEIVEMMDLGNDPTTETLVSFQNTANSSYYGAYYYPPMDPGPSQMKPTQFCADYRTCSTKTNLFDPRYAITYLGGLWWSLGENYTLTAVFTDPIPGYWDYSKIPPFCTTGNTSPQCQPTYVPPKRGTFRCDTFVRRLYENIGVPTSYFGLVQLPVNMMWAASKR